MSTSNTGNTGNAGHAILRNLILALLLVGAANLLIFSGLGFNTSGIEGGRMIPKIPGWAIGAVWTLLFAGLGIARGLMQANPSPEASRASTALLILILACIAYPFYTMGLRSTVIGLVGNIATAALALWAAATIRPLNRAALAAPLAVTAWLLFATAATLDQALL